MISHYLAIASNAIQQFVGSNLFNSAVVALASAFFGAKTAQGTAARNKFRDDITKEIRDTNAAISLAFAVCNSAMQIKRQHLRPLAEAHAHGKAALLDFRQKRKSGQISKDVAFVFRADLRALPIPQLVTDSLRAHVLDRLSITGRALHLAVAASESAAALCEAIGRRNELIKAFKDSGGPASKTFLSDYFGLPVDGTDGTLTDEVYSNTLDAMVLQCDCLIYFTFLLCADLKAHGDALLVKFGRRLGRKGLPRISDVDFGKASADNLIPPDSEFPDWHAAFLARPKPESYWKRAWRTLRRRRT